MLSDAGIERQGAVEAGTCLGQRSTVMRARASALSLLVVRLLLPDLFPGHRGPVTGQRSRVNTQLTGHDVNGGSRRTRTGRSRPKDDVFPPDVSSDYARQVSGQRGISDRRVAPDTRPGPDGCHGVSVTPALRRGTDAGGMTMPVTTPAWAVPSTSTSRRRRLW